MQNIKLQPFLDAIKVGKTVSFDQTEDFSHPFNGPDFCRTFFRFQYLPETDTVKIIKKTERTDYEESLNEQVMAWTEFELWFQQFGDRVYCLAQQN